MQPPRRALPRRAHSQQRDTEHAVRLLQQLHRVPVSRRDPPELPNGVHQRRQAHRERHPLRLLAHAADHPPEHGLTPVPLDQRTPEQLRRSIERGDPTAVEEAVRRWGDQTLEQILDRFWPDRTGSIGATAIDAILDGLRPYA